MATTLFYPVTGVLNVKSDTNRLDKAMDLYVDRESKVPMQGGQFFKEDRARTLDFKLSDIGNEIALPQRSNDSDPLPTDAPPPGYSLDISIPTFRQSVKIDETLMDTDQSGKVGNMMEGLVRTGRYFSEYKYAEPINSGFTANGSDGTTVFATDHPHEDSAAGTWSNLVSPASALSSSSVDTMRVGFRTRKNARGHISPIEMVSLVAPPQLQKTATEIVRSDKQPETQLNAINVWKGLNLIVWDYLTSATAWFGWGNCSQDQWGLHYVYIRKPQVRSLNYPTAEYPGIVAGWYLKTQIETAASRVKNMYGNAGA